MLDDVKHGVRIGVSSRVTLRALAVCTAVLGCGTSGPSGNATNIRDSAGIELVENVSPVWSNTEAWRLGVAPELEIGTREGDQRYEFDRVVDATRLANGDIVVADAGMSQLRMFDGQGGFLISAGGEGDGPGEFRLLVRLLRSKGDTLLAVDFLTQRMTEYDPTLSLIQTELTGATAQSSESMVIGQFESGTLVEQLGGSPLAVISGSIQVPAAYIGVAPGGASFDTIAEVPGTDGYLVRMTVRGQQAWANWRPPFGRTALAAVSGHALLVGNGDRYEVREYGEDGTLRRLIRRLDAQRTTTPDDLERLRALQLTQIRNANARRRWEAQFRNMPVPPTLPAFDSLLTDGDGNLWVRRYDIDAAAARTWDVFDGSGRWLGTVATPEEFRVLELGDDYVLGTWTDGFDVQYIRLYSLIKPVR